MEKITKREMFEALAAYAEATDMEVQIGDAVVTAADFAAFATKEIEQLDKKAVKAKERAAAKRADGDALTEAVLAVLTNEFQTAADIAAQIEDEDTTVGSLIEDTTFQSATAQIEANDLYTTVNAVLDTLDEREADILRYRFGLKGDHPHTLEEIGKIYGLTRERVRQLEDKAMRKLRHPARAAALREICS